MDSEYVPKHGDGNLAKNKIRVEGISHDKRCAQGKAGQGLFNSTILSAMLYTSKALAATKEE